MRLRSGSFGPAVGGLPAPRTREVGPCLAVAQASDGFWEWLKRLQAIRLIWEGDLVFGPSPPHLYVPCWLLSVQTGGRSSQGGRIGPVGLTVKQGSELFFVFVFAEVCLSHPCCPPSLN